MRTWKSEQSCAAAAWHTLTLHGTAPTFDSIARVSLRYILGRGDSISDEEFGLTEVGRLMSTLTEDKKLSLPTTRVDRDIQSGQVKTCTGNILNEFNTK